MSRPKGAKDKTKRKDRSAKWNNEELHVLYTSYHNHTKKELCSLLNKSYSAIRTMAKKLGLRKPNHVLPLCDIHILNSVAGVYGIYCIDTDKWYIGSSINIGNRLYNHILSLNNGTHYNTDLQEDWNMQYKFQAALFIKCAEDDLLTHEHELLKMPRTYNKNPGFNRIPKPIKDMVWDKIATGKPCDCWQWQGGTNSSGYGQFRSENKYYTAHRVAYASYYNEDIRGQLIRHKCNNKLCCNPHHLETGSYSQNSKDYWDSIGPSQKRRLLPYLEDIIAMRLNNHTYQEIANKYNCNNGTIYRLLKDFRPDIIELKMSCSHNNGNEPQIYDVDNQHLTISQIAQLPQCQCSESRLRKRIKDGIDIREAIAAPYRRKPQKPSGKLVKAFGETKYVVEWVKDDRCSCSKSTLLTRLSDGWEAEEAIRTPPAIPNKLTAEDIAHIVQSKESAKTLAQKYNVTPPTIYAVRRRNKVVVS